LKLRTIEGTTPFPSCEKLADLASHVPSDQAIVEVGVYKGRTLCHLAHGSQQGLGASPVYGVDTWDLPGLGGKHRVARSFAEQAVIEHGFAGLVVLVQGFSVEIARTYDGPAIGLLFIDGDHSETGVRSDFMAWQPHLADGACVVFDDYGGGRNPGVRRAVNALSESFSGPPEIHGLMAILEVR
jgi:hypothetical protein